VTDLIQLAIAPTSANWSVANNVGPPSTAAFNVDGIASSYGFTIYASDNTATAATEADVEAGVVVNIAGTAGNEYLVGGLNNDTISGGSGNDMLGGIGRKEVITIAGTVNAAETVTFTANGVAAALTVGASPTTSTVASDLADKINTTSATSFVTAKADGAVVTVTYFNYLGAAGATTETLGGTAVVTTNISTDYGAGDDRLTGDGGNDTIFGGAGADTIDGGTGNDVIYGGAGADSLTGSSGNDTFVTSTDATIDVITDFTSGADTINVGTAGVFGAAKAGTAFVTTATSASYGAAATTAVASNSIISVVNATGTAYAAADVAALFATTAAASKFLVAAYSSSSLYYVVAERDTTADVTRLSTLPTQVPRASPALK